jgi:transcriptional regulator with XRE-family HTH domain
MTYGDTLRARRLARGLSQDALAERGGFTQAEICAFETTKRIPRKSTRARIEAALGPPTPLDEALGVAGDLALRLREAHAYLDGLMVPPGTDLVARIRHLVRDAVEMSRGRPAPGGGAT